jgi:hypothetical protein
MLICNVVRQGLLAATILGLILGVANSPARAQLGPPVISFAAVWMETPNDSSAQLFAYLQVEVPGGRVPQDIASVTVQIPGEVTPRAMPRNNLDLAPDRAYFLNLTDDGVVGFPTGTYTFRATDTAANVTTATDALGASRPLGAFTITSHADNQIIPPSPPTVTWSVVPGAATYRVRIRNGWMDQDLFSRDTTGTSLTLPGGVLGPGRRYMIRVEAYDHVNGFPDADARARRDIQVETQGPDIFFTFPSGNYTAGSTLTLTARVWNTHAPVYVDAEVWIGIPGSNTSIMVLMFWNVFLPQVLTGDVYNGDLGFSYTFNGSEPNGVYVVGFRLLYPTTGETIAVTTRTFTKS